MWSVLLQRLAVYFPRRKKGKGTYTREILGRRQAPPRTVLGSDRRVVVHALCSDILRAAECCLERG